MINFQIKIESIPKINTNLNKILKKDDVIEIHKLHVIYFLRDVELSIWNQINGKISIHQIIYNLSKEYNEKEEIIKNDVLDFITALNDKDLILL